MNRLLFLFGLILISVISFGQGNFFWSHSGRLCEAWDIECYEYSGVSVSVQGDITSSGLYFSPDGTKMYQTDYIEGKIYQSTLSTAWDLSTASYDSVSISTQEIIALDVFFSPDGTKMYEIDKRIGPYDVIIYQYTLSTAWDLSTASYDGVSMSTHNENASRLFFKPDGTKMYVGGAGTVFQFTLTTAWDLSTASSDGVSATAGEGLFFKPDGTKMYGTQTGFPSGKIHQYTLSTAWDLSTASYDGVSMSTHNENPVDVFFSSDGTKMYDINYGESAVINQYELKRYKEWKK